MATRQLTIFDVKLPTSHMNYEDVAERKLEQKLQGLLKALQNRARAEGVPFDLGVTFLRAIMTERCPYLDVPISYTGSPTFLGRASLDRIIPERGYVAGNVRFISQLANTMKQDATIPQLVAFAHGVLRVHGQDATTGLTEGPLPRAKKRRKSAGR